MRFADRFELESVAGEGGAGRVYRAIDGHTGERVALKVLLADGGTAVDAGRFAREAALLAELSHPAVVRYVAHGRTPAGEPWLAMEWLDGVTLRDRLDGRGLSLAETVALCVRVAGALGAAHARGVLHRDVKPENLLLPDDDATRVKLLDFGIARLTRARNARTRTGVVIGTPGYMAPEQARGERDVDARADVFSLGCVLFECASGRAAFEGEHVMAVLARILLEPSPRLSDVCDGVPSALDALCARMLAKGRDERPADMNAVLAALGAMGPLDSAARALHATRPPALTGGEQRLLSVVLASGDDEATTLAATARTVAMTAHDGLAATVTTPDVAFETLLDGTLVATLAGGDATDQAARAARCALGLRAKRPGATITLAAGLGVLERGMPLGEVIDRAAALLADERARGGGGAFVRLDDVAASLLEGRFDVVRDPSGARLRGERVRGGDGARMFMGRATPFVGRDRELAALEAAYHESAGDEVARAVVITGSPGMGKSRVRDELLARVARHATPPAVWIGRGDPLGVQSPYGLLASAVREAASLREGVALSEQRAAVVAWVATHVPRDRVERVAAYVGELAGVPSDAPRGDAVALGDQIRGAWLDLLEATLAARPLLIVLEDIQWGDLPSVQLVDASLRAHGERPLLVVAFARPELDEVFPGLFAQRSMQRMNLAPLARRAAERMARAALGDDATDAVVARVVERAGGNALFIEELARARGGDDALPPSILALMQARLEALDPEARRVLRAASVFGRAFWRGGLEALLGGAERAPQLDAWLALLEERELITPRAPARFAGEHEWAFHHALLRDAAYATLTDADRPLGHRLAGAWLEHAGELDAVPLAEHFERGGEPARAVGHWLHAARHALAGDDLVHALAHAERGVACGAQGEPLGALREIQADALRWQGRHEAVVAPAREAVALLPRGSGTWYAAATSLALAYGRLERSEPLAAICAEVLALAPPDPVTAEAGSIWAALAAWAASAGQTAAVAELLVRMESADGTAAAARDPAVQARVHEARATRHYRTGDTDAYAREMLALAACLTRAGRLRDACREQSNAGDALIELGRFDEAEALCTASLATSERLGLSSLLAMQHINMASARIGNGAYDAAEAHIEAGLAKHATPLWQGLASVLRATMALRRDDATAAERFAREAVALTSVATLCVHALAVQAMALARLGAFDDAVAAVDASMQRVGDAGAVIVEQEAAVRLYWVEALTAAGQSARARSALREARDRLLARASKIADVAARRLFLERDPAKARTLALAAQWLGDAS